MQPILAGIQAFLLDRWNKFKDFWVNTEQKDRVRFILISSIALIGIIIAVVMLNRTTWVPLMDSETPLEAADVTSVQTALRSQGVKQKLDAQGNILVPDKNRQQAIYDLAQQGIPSAGTSYAFLNDHSGFSTTADERRDWRRIQSQSDIQDTLVKMNPYIKAARVEIAEPNNNAAFWQSEKEPVTASVTLMLSNVLTDSSVNGIITMVSASYPGLLPENVFVTDQSMEILNPGPPPEIDSLMEHEQMRTTVQSDFNRAILQLLIPVFGADHVSVATNVELDFDDKSVEEITFTPVVDEQGIARSVKEIIETATGNTGIVGGTPGIDDNGFEDGDTPSYTEVTTDKQASTWASTSRETNFEINQTVEKVIQAKGKLTKVTASVIIDNNNLEQSDAVKDYKKSIQALTATAIGLTEKDYDLVSVDIMPMSGRKVEVESMKKFADAAARADLFELIKTIVLYLVLGACLALLIHRVYKFFKKEVLPEDLLTRDGLIEEFEGEDEYAGIMGLTTKPEELEMPAVKSEERLRVEDFLDRNPEMVASLLRSWMAEEPLKKR